MSNHSLTSESYYNCLVLFSKGWSKLSISKTLKISRNTLKRYISIFEDMPWIYDILTLLNEDQVFTLYKRMRNKTFRIKSQLIEKTLTPFLELKTSKAYEKYRILNPDGYKRSQFYTAFKKARYSSHPHSDAKIIFKVLKKKISISSQRDEFTSAFIIVAVLNRSGSIYAESTIDCNFRAILSFILNVFKWLGGIPRIIFIENRTSKANNDFYIVLKLLCDESQIKLNVGNLDYDCSIISSVLVDRFYFTKFKDLTIGCSSVCEYNFALVRYFNTINNEQKWFDMVRCKLFSEDQMSFFKKSNYWDEIEFSAVATARQNGHVLNPVDKNFYSIPFEYINRQICILSTSARVDIYHDGLCISTHNRSYSRRSYTSYSEHLPSFHGKEIGTWDATRIIKWAASISPEVGNYILEIINSKQFPEQAYSSCLAILNLINRARKHECIEACRTASNCKKYSYGYFKRTLEIIQKCAL